MHIHYYFNDVIFKTENCIYIYIFQIGVNAYSFAITNNGHILYHPNLRPLVSILLFFLKFTFHILHIYSL